MNENEVLNEVARLEAENARLREALDKLIIAAVMRRSWDDLSEQDFNIAYHLEDGELTFKDVKNVLQNALVLARKAL